VTVACSSGARPWRSGEMGKSRSGVGFGAATADPDGVTTRIGTGRVGGRGSARKEEFFFFLEKSNCGCA
jgi:hypothetical protein